MRESTRRPPRLEERGLSLLETLVVAAVVAVLVAIAVPPLVASMRAAREARAIANVRTIAAAQMEVYARARRFAVFEELIRTGAIARQFRREAGGGRRGTATEVISDGVYGYSMRFARDAE